MLVDDTKKVYQGQRIKIDRGWIKENLKLMSVCMIFDMYDVDTGVCVGIQIYDISICIHI